MTDLFMGIDIGTSGVRAAVFDRDGAQIGLFHREYPLICIETSMAELDPDLVFQSLLDVVKRCIEDSGVSGHDIKAVGLSTQLFSFMAVDGHGRKLTHLVTWADNRASLHADSIRDRYDVASLYSKTGCRTQHPMYPLSKILWYRETQPENFKKAAKFITIKEYILFKLYNEFVIDRTDASATACMNIHRFEWESTIVQDILGLDNSRFGEIVACTHLLKGMKKEYAAVMGLDPDVPVAAGSGDGMLANVGCGVFDDTAMSCTIGTSGALRVAVDRPLLDPLQRTWCYCFTKDTWVAGGAINNGGIVLQWLRDEYRECYEEEARRAGLASIYALFDRYAEEIRAGSDGLIFLPLLTGERSPNWNANARGVLYGLSLRHGRKHQVRAAMEGVMYRMFSLYEILSGLNDNVRQVRANGGYVNSEIWLQIQADIFGREIAVAGIGEATVFGAAYVAMAATGAIRDMKVPLPAMEPRRVILPDLSSHEIYKEGFLKFKDLYRRIYD